MKYVRMAAAAVLLSSCFSPTFQEGLACDDGMCPPGFECDSDDVCRATAVQDSSMGIDGPIIDADVAIPDAPIDAVPVECTSSAQCQNPSDPCLLPGTCSINNVCVFPPKDCSSLNDDCNVGVCNATSGVCEAQPSNETNACGAGTTCGNFGTCGGFADTCDNTGTQTQSCQDFTCQGGTCVASAPYDNSQACSRNTNGDGCGSETTTNCNSCGNFSSTCDNTGTQTCTCTTFSCLSGSCQPNATSCTQACSRNTNGDSCGTPTTTNCGNCNYSGFCDESAQRTCTCNTFSCSSGTCQTNSTSCTEPCMRNREGQVCDIAACSQFTFREICCLNGQCTNPCGPCKQ